MIRKAVYDIFFLLSSFQLLIWFHLFMEWLDVVVESFRETHHF